ISEANFFVASGAPPSLVSGCIVGAVGRVNTDFELSEHIAERILSERLKSLFSWMSSPGSGSAFFTGRILAGCFDSAFGICLTANVGCRIFQRGRADQPPKLTTRKERTAAPLAAAFKSHVATLSSFSVGRKRSLSFVRSRAR
ncbi:hypothetical protein, partial [Mesorhizobium sp.]|uniref:hypothetical protein n=1 Tax=Mesorhizobium sp. TaxID=1871066 RepID=UPI0025E0D850